MESLFKLLNVRHEAEGGTADALQERGQRRVGTEVARIGRIVNIEEEGQCDEDTTANDEGKHMGYTVHGSSGPRRDPAAR